MEPIKEYYAKQAQVIITNMQKRNFEAYYVDNMDEAKKKIVELLGEKKSIGYGGSMTLKDADMYNYLKSKGHEIIERDNYKTEEEQKELKKKLITCDAFFTSANAITMEGEIINIDGNSNRVCYITYGPESVYVVVGMNKVTVDRETGLKRASNVASPMNAIRLDRGTPCTKAGKCMNCLDGTICCNIVITRYSRAKKRIKVILVGEELGY